MGFVSKFLKQKAVLWKNPVPGQFGKYIFDIGIEIDVRWEDKMVKIRNNKNMEVLSKARIMVDVDIEPGEYLYLGELNSLTVQEQANPFLIEDAYEILAKEKTPNIRATDFVRTAWV